MFLDRDGTLNVPPEPGGYVLRPEGLKLVPGAGEAVRRLKEAGFFLALATNQRCVARGLVSEETLEAIHGRLQDLLRAEGAPALDAIHFCPDDRGSPRRKPSPAMLLEAAAEHGLDLGRSWMIGDSVKDAEAGLAAGCRSVLVEHPGTAAERASIPLATLERIETVSNLAQAVDVVLKEMRARR